MARKRRRKRKENSSTNMVNTSKLSTVISRKVTATKSPKVGKEPLNLSSPSTDSQKNDGTDDHANDELEFENDITGIDEDIYKKHQRESKHR